MIFPNKKVMLVDLNREESEVKTLPDLHKYFGGFSLGIKLFEMHREHNPLIFAIGPLNGFYPYASKTAIIYNNGKIRDIYIGGALGSRIRFCDLDAIVFLGKAKNSSVISIEDHQTRFYKASETPEILGLPGKKATLEDSGVLDDYFHTQQYSLVPEMKRRNIKQIVVTANTIFELKDPKKYKKQVDSLLGQEKHILAEKGFFPSCSMCPIGCAQSKEGEEAGDILLHSLVGCAYAKNVLSNINTVFSCLNVLGYHYTHEDLENLPELTRRVLVTL